MAATFGSKTHRGWVDFDDGGNADRSGTLIPIFGNYDGATPGAQIQAAIDDQAARLDGTLWINWKNAAINNVIELDEPLYAASNVSITGWSQHFGGCQLRATGDFPALKTTGVDSPGTLTTRFSLDHVHFRNNNNATTYALDLRDCHSWWMRDIQVHPSADGGVYNYLRLIDSDSVSFTRLACNGAYDGSQLLYVDAMDVWFSHCKFEADNAEKGEIYIKGHTVIRDSQFERVEAVITGQGPTISHVGGASTNIYVHPDAINWTVEDIYAGTLISAGSLWGRLRNIHAANALFAPDAAMIPSPLRSLGVAGERYQFTAAAGDELFLSARYDGRETTADNTAAQVVAGVTTAQALAWSGSETLADRSGPTTTDGGRLTRMFAVRGRTGDSALEVSGPGFLTLQAYNNLVPGSFSTNAGAFDISGWGTTNCTATEAAPFHTSQNRTVTGTFSSTGTAVTGSGTNFDPEVTVGDYLYYNGEWRKVTARASDTGLTLASGFTSDASAQPVIVARPWVSISASGGWGFYYNVSTFEAGRRYLALARIYNPDDESVFLCHGSSWNGNDDLRPVLTLVPTRTETKLSDGSVIVSMPFSFQMANGRISIGASATAANPVYVGWVAVIGDE